MLGDAKKMHNPQNRLDKVDIKNTFDPFEGLDDIEPIEKKSQYSDDNDDGDVDAIADERQQSQNVHTIENASRNLSN